MENKLNEIVERIHSIERIMDRNTVSLEQHMKRTEVAEENLELLRNDVRLIEKHVIRVDGVFKFIGLLGIISTLIVSLVKLFN